MKKNMQALEAAQRDLDARLKSNAQRSNSTVQSMASSIRPHITSLGRVGGGGGAGNAFRPMVSEQKRTNSILSRHLPYLAGRQGIQAIV